MPYIVGFAVVVAGLALSFGSQTLVKDIVSGIFYLTDDAFRVGEHIDCEKAKGTVEGFTLRSVRLRARTGQLHCRVYEPTTLAGATVLVDFHQDGYTSAASRTGRNSRSPPPPVWRTRSRC